MASSDYNAKKEAEDFYRLYRAGVDVEKLRLDIGVKDQTVEFWTALRNLENDHTAAEAIRLILPFRREVLKRFDCLVAGVEFVKVRRPGNSSGDKFARVDGRLSKVKAVDGFGRRMRIETIARILGIEQVKGEYYSEFKRRVRAAQVLAQAVSDLNPVGARRTEPMGVQPGDGGLRAPSEN